MSRIGSAPIQIPSGVTVTLGERVLVSGPKGELAVPLTAHVSVTQKEDMLMVACENTKEGSAVHGSIRATLYNAVIGVTTGWTKKLELSGVGYRAGMSGNTVELNVGFSHPVVISPPSGITLSVVDGKIVVYGVNRQIVGQIAADIRAVKPPEPYKGKGIKYEGEIVRKKAGKSAKAVGGSAGTGGK